MLMRVWNIFFFLSRITTISIDIIGWMGRAYHSIQYIEIRYMFKIMKDLCELFRYKANVVEVTVSFRYLHTKCENFRHSLVHNTLHI